MALLLIQINGVAQAQGAPDDARQLFERGRRAYSAGRYDEARDAWVGAYERSGHADLLYNIAQAYRGLGLAVQELEYLQRFVAAVPITHDSRAAARERAQAIEARIAATRVVLSQVPRSADVLLDGALVAGEGEQRTLQVAPGPHQVVVALDGHLPFHATVDAVAGRSTELIVRLQERPVARAHTADGATRAVWASGAALLAVGAVSGGAAFRAADGTVSSSARADRLRRVGFAADGMLAAGVVLGVVGLVRYLRSDGEVASDSTRVSLDAAPGRVAVLLQGAF